MTTATKTETATIMGAFAGHHKAGSVRTACTPLLPDAHRLSPAWTALLAFVGVLVVVGLKTASASPTVPIPTVDIPLPGLEADQGGLTALKILGMLTVLTLAPAILMTMTSFTRIIIVFSFIRHAMGTQQAPPNQIMVGLALFLTFFIMKPVIDQIHATAFLPYQEGTMEGGEALDRALQPVKGFMLHQTRENDLALFYSISGEARPDTPNDVPIHLLVPAFIISELKTAFQMGFILFIPFLVLDMVVSATLMAMGMMMLPPVLISLPFKIMLFVLVDGWNLLIGSLVRSFA